MAHGNQTCTNDKELFVEMQNCSFIPLSKMRQLAKQLTDIKTTHTEQFCNQYFQIYCTGSTVIFSK